MNTFKVVFDGFFNFFFLIQHNGVYNLNVLTQALNMCREANTMTSGNVLI